MPSRDRAREHALAIALLRESTGVWGVAATVDAGVLPQVAVLRCGDGCEISVDAASAEEAPVRWWVRWNDADLGQGRVRPCASAVGLLRTVRDALGVPAGLRLAIAPGEPTIT